MANNLSEDELPNDALTDDEWRAVLELSQAAAEIPEAERLAFLRANTGSETVIHEVLALVSEFSSSDATLPGIGSRIGRFVLTGTIGRGGMGEVYTARDTELERTVALKFLHSHLFTPAGGADAFIREARTASALNHPNIVTIHEVIRSGPALAIVMEYVEGTSLRKLCGAPLPALDVIQIGQQIARALAAAHSEGIVHRDIKPENAILRPDRSVKVLDFGLALWVASERAGGGWIPGSGAGTWRYMSPEQARGEAVTSASDVFSLGLILYELVAGRHPFPAASPFESLKLLATCSPEPPPEHGASVSQALNALILRMLARQPAARPSAQEVVQRLNDLEWLARAAPASRRKTITLAAGIMAALAALLAAAWWLRHSENPPKPIFSQVTTLVAENRATAAAISPDGKIAAFANVDGIFLKPAGSATLTILQAPRDLAVEDLVWFRDGSRLLASGSPAATNQSSIWIVPANGAASRKIGGEGIDGAPSPDGKRIAFISRDRTSLYVEGLGGETPRQVLPASPGDTFLVPVWSADSRRLGFQRRHYSSTQDLGYVIRDRYYRRSFEFVDVDSGRITAKNPDIWMQSAALLPDGRLLFLRWDPPGSEFSDEVWEAATDSVTGRFVGKPRKIASPVASTPDHVVGLTSSLDGKQVMMLRRLDANTIYIADFQPSPPRLSNNRRLTFDDRTNYPHAWTADSQTVIFESDRNGNWSIFKQPLNRHTPDLVAGAPGKADVLPQLSPDGRWILYAESTLGERLGTYKLMRVAVNGGTPAEVPIGGPLDEFRCAAAPEARCVLRVTVGRQYRVFYELDPVHGKGKELARIAWTPRVLWDWDISSDGNEVAMPNHSPSSAHIHIVSLNGGKEREVVLAGVSDLSGVNFAVNGRGWFASVSTPLHDRLLFVYPDGKWTLLPGLQRWAVPSPDGRHIANCDHEITVNAWMLKFP